MKLDEYNEKNRIDNSNNASLVIAFVIFNQ
jgi:hypothetical protein